MTHMLPASLTKRSLILILVVGLLLIGSSVTFARAPVPLDYDAYFIAPYEDIDQVWGFSLDTQETTVITQAAEGIYNYAISPDNTRIVYTSGKQLWLDTLTETPQKLAAIDEPLEKVSLVFTPDGQSLIYADRGILLLDLATGQSERLLNDFHDPDHEYQALQYGVHGFLSDDYLVISESVADYGLSSIYSLSSHRFQQTKPSYKVSLLQDGRYLYDMGQGLENLFIGDLPDESRINSIPVPVPLIAQPFAELQLIDVSIADIVEMAPGRLRFIGWTIPQEPLNVSTKFIGEYDLTTRQFSLDISEATNKFLDAENAFLNDFSADGRYIAGYTHMGMHDGRNFRGLLRIANLDTMSYLSIKIKGTAMHFQWAQKHA